MLGSPSIRWSYLARFCRQAGIALAAGVDIRTMLKTEVGSTPARYRPTMQHLHAAVSSGESLSDGMRGTGSFFPPLVHDFVAAGERSGSLAEVFTRLADHYDFMLGLRRTYLIAIIWPALMLLAASLIVLILILAAGWVSSMAGEMVDFLGFGLVGVSGAVRYLAFVATCILLCGLLVHAGKKGWLPVDQAVLVLMHLPAIGNGVKMPALTRMSWTMALAADCGMSAREIMRSSLKSTGNLFYMRLIDDVDRRVQNGSELHEALSVTRAFPNDFVDSVAIGEQTGLLSETMYRLSKEYQSRAKLVSGSLVAGAALLTWGLVAALLIFLIFRLFSFYVGTIQSLT